MSPVAFPRGAPVRLFLLFVLVARATVDAFRGARRGVLLRRAGADLLRPSAMSVDGDAHPTPIRAGFVGCGTIASALATGLAAPGHASHLAARGLALASIGVTRRSADKSARLREKFPGVVTVHESPADVVANADVVFLCVLPRHVDGVLEELKEKGVWRTGHTLISLVVRLLCLVTVFATVFPCAVHPTSSTIARAVQSTSNVEDLIRKTGLPRGDVYKMICLPAIAKREGCALLQPAPARGGATEEAEEAPPAAGRVDPRDVLEALGGCVVCPDDGTMHAMMVTTAMMGPMYGVMRRNRDWLGESTATYCLLPCLPFGVPVFHRPCSCVVLAQLRSKAGHPPR